MLGLWDAMSRFVVLADSHGYKLDQFNVHNNLFTQRRVLPNEKINPSKM